MREKIKRIASFCSLLFKEILVKGAVIALIVAFPASLGTALIVSANAGLEIWKSRWWFLLAGLAIATVLFRWRLRRTTLKSDQPS